MDLLLLGTVTLSLFLIVDPIAAVPLLLGITQANTPQERKAMVRRAVMVATIVLAFFAAIGQIVLNYLAVELSAVKVAGGILLFVIGMEVLFGHLSKTRHTQAEEAEAEEKEDVSITPLAVPLLAGPGAVTVVLTSVGPSRDLALMVTVLLAIILVMVASWITLAMSDRLYRVLGAIGVKVVARVFGLLLIFMAAQQVLEGLRLAGVLG